MYAVVGGRHTETHVFSRKNRRKCFPNVLHLRRVVYIIFEGIAVSVGRRLAGTIPYALDLDAVVGYENECRLIRKAAMMIIFL